MFRNLVYLTVLACFFTVQASPSVNQTNISPFQNFANSFEVSASSPLESVSDSQITLDANGFNPGVLNVTVGTKVVWFNDTNQSHILRSGFHQIKLHLPLILGKSNNSTGITESAGGEDIPIDLQTGNSFGGTLPSGGTFAYTFNSAGNFPFYLETAPQFQGHVAVTLAPLPPDPSSIAPTLDLTVSTDIYTATLFLYTGNDPIQTGVESGTIDPQRVAVVRGRVLDEQGLPFPEVNISILDHPEFGQTVTRLDGMFDLVVNGGGPLTVVYNNKAGYLPSQRQFTVPWRNYIWSPDVVLRPLDDKVTPINLVGAAEIQVARSSIQSDRDGRRQATLLFPPNTHATMNIPLGEITVQSALSSMSVRATEYTVGEDGPNAMPAILPPQSGYTYAVDFTADEAQVAGALDVQFDQPVYFYLEDFIGFPVGSPVPSGFYDQKKSQWVASENGVVIEILSVTAYLADLDTDGDGKVDDAATLSALGITDAEREKLAGLYTPPQRLWRVPIQHFSPWDINWPYGLPDDAEEPDISDIESLADFEDNPCDPPRPIVECQNQTLGESVEVTGTPFTLNYRSERVPGRLDAYTVEIPLIKDEIPTSLRRIELEVSVAGRLITETLAADTSQHYTFTWNGKDAYGRKVLGAQPTVVRVGYVYGAEYKEPGEFAQSFGRFGGATIEGLETRQEIILWQEQTVDLGTLDAGTYGIGGWTLDVHHIYAPSAGVLYRGDGSRLSAQAVPPVITTVAGGGNQDDGPGDGGPATEAYLYSPVDVALAPDGSFYIVDINKHNIRRVGPDGIITTVAGTGEWGFSGDGGLATDAQLSWPRSVVVGPNDSFYIADEQNNRIRRVGPDGIITTVAGTGKWGEDLRGDGKPATEVDLATPYCVAVGPDGSLYICDPVTNSIRRVGPDGILTTVAGTGFSGFSGDGGQATQAQLRTPYKVVVGPDGSLYIADIGNDNIRRVSPDGIITTVAGNGTEGYSGDGGPATEAQLRNPWGIDMAPDGKLYIADKDNNRLRLVGLDGIITTVAGSGSTMFSFKLGDDGPATLAELYNPSGVAVDPHGSIYIADRTHSRIRLVRNPLSGFAVGDSIIPSEDGSGIFVFSSSGRHLRTLHALTGKTLYQFSYDSSGRLVTVKDGDGNITTVERNTAGNPTAIISPYGQRTSLSLNAEGFLASITNPNSESFKMAYTEMGLLTSFTTPRGNVYRFTYDELGRLVQHKDPGGASAALSRSELEAGYQVMYTDAKGHKTTYLMESYPTDNQRRLRTDPSGATTELMVDPSGDRMVTFPDGRILTLVQQPDPRFGMLAPLVGTLTISTTSGLASVTSVDPSVTLTDPDGLSRIEAMNVQVDVNGRVYKTTYDGGAHTTTRTTPEGRATVITMDELGRATELIPGPDLLPMTFTFDEHGNLTHLAQGTQFWSYTYDAKGRVLSITNAVGDEVTFGYDDADRLVEYASPAGRTYTFAYDAIGNRTQVTMPSGAVHQFTFTKLDFEASYTPPGGAAYATDYDLDRAPSSYTLPSSRKIEHAWQDGRLASVGYPEATIAFDYLSPGCCGTDERVSQITRTPSIGGSVQELSFDYDSHLTTQLSWSGFTNGTYTYQYDHNFFLVGYTLDGGSRVTLTRDDDGLLTGFGPFAFTRSGPAGATSKISDGVLINLLTYDYLGRLESRTVSVAGEEVYKLELSYDNAGRITQKVETKSSSTHTFTYTYDPDGWLTQVKKDAVVVESYAYDANGNRTSTLAGNATYDQQDRLTGYAGVSYQFDEDGFLTQRDSDTFKYSARGELLEAKVAGTTITYTYDGLWRRVARSDSSGTYQYLYGNYASPYQITAIRDSSGTLTEYYYDDTGYLYAFKRASKWYYVTTDQVGSPRVIVDANGNVVKSIEYDSFGMKLSDSAPGFELPVGYAGGLDDLETGLLRFGFRDYDPVTGRWTARDPILFAGGQTNLYAYVGNNPVNLRDPTGLFCVGGGLGYLGYVGGDVCCNLSQGCSACAEIGLGYGGGWSIDPFGGLPREGWSTNLEASVSFYGFGATGSITNDDECGTKTGGDIDILGFSPRSGSYSGGDGPSASIFGTEVQIKATVKYCSRLF